MSQTIEQRAADLVANEGRFEIRTDSLVGGVIVVDTHNRNRVIAGAETRGEAEEHAAHPRRPLVRAAGLLMVAWFDEQDVERVPERTVTVTHHETPANIPAAADHLEDGGAEDEQTVPVQFERAGSTVATTGGAVIAETRHINLYYEPETDEEYLADPANQVWEGLRLDNDLILAARDGKYSMRRVGRIQFARNRERARREVNALGDVILDLMRTRGVTKADLVEKLNLPVSEVVNLPDGLQGLRFYDLMLIAAHLGTTPSDLACEVERRARGEDTATSNTVDKGSNSRL